jgi:hypothetical protein
LNHQILNALDEEIERLKQARAILTEGSKARPARKSSSTQPRRIFSEKARHAIAEAQRKRWAKVRGEKKPAGPAVETATEFVAS